MTSDQVEREKELEGVRSTMVRVEKEKTSQILLLGNENSHLQSKCEELESRVANIMQNLEGSTKNSYRTL